MNVAARWLDIKPAGSVRLLLGFRFDVVASTVPVAVAGEPRRRPVEVALPGHHWLLTLIAGHNGTPFSSFMMK